MEKRAYGSGWMEEKPRDNNINAVRTTPKFN